MIDQNFFIALRDALAFLYPDESSARRVTHDANLNSSLIQFSNQAKNNWHAILTEANKGDHKMLELIHVVLLDYGDNSSLRDICLKILREVNRDLSQQVEKLKQDLELARRQPEQEKETHITQEYIRQIDKLEQELTQVRLQLKERRNRPSFILTVYSWILIGFGIGWLVGLSVSQTVSIIMIALVGSMATLAAVLNGLDNLTTSSDTSATRYFINRRISLMPLTLLITGMVIGSMLGIYSRTHNWLGVSQSGLY